MLIVYFNFPNSVWGIVKKNKVSLCVYSFEYGIMFNYSFPFYPSLSYLISLYTQEVSWDVEASANSQFVKQDLLITFVATVVND